MLRRAEGETCLETTSLVLCNGARSVMQPPALFHARCAVLGTCILGQTTNAALVVRKGCLPASTQDTPAGVSWVGPSVAAHNRHGRPAGSFGISHEITQIALSPWTVGSLQSSVI